MRIGVAFEKRDWGSGRRTWRRVPSTMVKYRKDSKGPSEFAVRTLSNRAAKRQIFR